MIRILVAASALCGVIGLADDSYAACPGNTQTSIVFSYGVLTTPDAARSTLDNVLAPAVRERLGSGVDGSCVTFSAAQDSLFVDSGNQIVDLANIVPQLVDGLGQLGIDFAAN